MALYFVIQSAFYIEQNLSTYWLKTFLVMQQHITNHPAWLKTCTVGICFTVFVLLTAQILSYSLTVIVEENRTCRREPTTVRETETVVWPLAVVPYWVDVRDTCRQPIESRLSDRMAPDMPAKAGAGCITIAKAWR